MQSLKKMKKNLKSLKATEPFYKKMENFLKSLEASHQATEPFYKKKIPHDAENWWPSGKKSPKCWISNDEFESK